MEWKLDRTASISYWNSLSQSVLSSLSITSFVEGNVTDTPRRQFPNQTLPSLPSIRTHQPTHSTASHPIPFPPFLSRSPITLNTTQPIGPSTMPILLHTDPPSLTHSLTPSILFTSINPTPPTKPIILPHTLIHPASPLPGLHPIHHIAHQPAHSCYKL